MSTGMETTLIELVKRYSPSGQEGVAVSWLVERMQKLGYDRSFVDSTGNAVGVMGEGDHQMVLLGHIDTVPGNLTVEVVDGILYGRGSVDAKAPLACFTDAVARLGRQPGWQLVVIGAIDEERESRGVRGVIRQYQPEFLLVGEPNHWDRIALGYKGTAWVSLRVEREQSHSAGGNPTATELLVNAWLKIKQYTESYNQGKTRMFDQALLTLGDIRSSSDGLVQAAEMEVGVRLPPEIRPGAWVEQVHTLLPEIEVTPIGFPAPAWQCDKNTPLVRGLLSGIRLQGGVPSFVYKTGTADLNVAAPAWGCPAAVYGPGDSSLDHTPGECIPLEEYGRAVQVLVEALRKITAPPQEGSGSPSL